MPAANPVDFVRPHHVFSEKNRCQLAFLPKGAVEGGGRHLCWARGLERVIPEAIGLAYHNVKAIQAAGLR